MAHLVLGEIEAAVHAFDEATTVLGGCALSWIEAEEVYSALVLLAYPARPDRTP